MGKFATAVHKLTAHHLPYRALQAGHGTKGRRSEGGGGVSRGQRGCGRDDDREDREEYYDKWSSSSNDSGASGTYCTRDDKSSA